MRTVNLVQYLMLTMSELLLFTYCGELLRQHSIRAGDAMWRAEWWTHANVIRKDMLIFLINSRRMVKLTAGKFYVMDVERLRGVSALELQYFKRLWQYIYFIEFHRS